MSIISDFKNSAFGLFSQGQNPSHLIDCGQRFATADGREVVLVQNGTVALAAGNLAQHSPIVANHVNNTVTAYVAANASTGALPTITMTVGATKVNNQQYQLGFAIVNAGTGIGQTLQIRSCPNVAASGSLTIVLEDAPAVALDTSSKVTLIAQPYTGVVINPTTSTAAPAGVTITAIPASVANTYDGTTGALTATGTYQYGWILTRGITSCLAQGAIGVGLGIAPSGSVAGAVAVVAATTNQLGSAYQAGVDTEARAVAIRL